MANVLIAGCGYVGTALGVRLAAARHRVWGLRRTCPGLPSSIEPFTADLSVPETLRELPRDLEVVFYTAGAASFSDSAYKSAYVDGLTHLLEALREQGQRPSRIFFTSSTGVYAQDAGEWLDERSPAMPSKFSGLRLVEAESALLGAGYPATIVRLGGIYGPGRTRLIEQVRNGTARLTEGRTCYLNLIHRDDCAGVLAHLMGMPHPDSMYIAVDNEPVERNALLGWIAEQLGLPKPPTASSEEATEPQRGGNRRFRNARLLATGYQFAYPSFREGYLSDLPGRAPSERA